ncbi:MAG: hypothetical protein LBR25_05305, partial [Erysipelotrichaceae bacterium]|nr:hypothetical protein [Erysipelotrichaceae bacterium]
MNNISAGEVCCVLAGALVFLFALLHKKFRRLTKVVFVFVMSFAMLLQTVYALSEVKQKENATKAL